MLVRLLDLLRPLAAHAVAVVNKVGGQRQECCGLYPSTRRALSIDSNVSCSPRSPVTGTSGKTSATRSALVRDMTVSAAAMMNDGPGRGLIEFVAAGAWGGMGWRLGSPGRNAPRPHERTVPHHVLDV